MVRHHREDDDDVTLPSWGQLVQRVDGRRMSNSPSDGPVHPAETYDNRSSGNVYSQSQPVKHTRFRHDGDNDTDDPVDDVYTTGEYKKEVTDRQNFVESPSTNILHLAPNRMGPRSYVSRNNDEEDGSRTVVDMESTHISHLAPARVASSAGNDSTDVSLNTTRAMSESQLVMLKSLSQIRCCR